MSISPNYRDEKSSFSATPRPIWQTLDTAAAYLEFELVLAGPQAYPPQTSILENWHQKDSVPATSPKMQQLVESADALYTDAVSMVMKQKEKRK